MFVSMTQEYYICELWLGINEKQRNDSIEKLKSIENMNVFVHYRKNMQHYAIVHVHRCTPVSQLFWILNQNSKWYESYVDYVMSISPGEEQLGSL